MFKAFASFSALVLVLAATPAHADGPLKPPQERARSAQPERAGKAPMIRRHAAKRAYTRHADGQVRLPRGPRFVLFSSDPPPAVYAPARGPALFEPAVRPVRVASAEELYRAPRTPRMVYFDPPHLHNPGYRWQ